MMKACGKGLLRRNMPKWPKEIGLATILESTPPGAVQKPTLHWTWIPVDAPIGAEACFKFCSSTDKTSFNFNEKHTHRLRFEWDKCFAHHISTAIMVVKNFMELTRCHHLWIKGGQNECDYVTRLFNYFIPDGDQHHFTYSGELAHVVPPSARDPETPQLKAMETMVMGATVVGRP
jgi:hypothetical protein